MLLSRSHVGGMEAIKMHGGFQMMGKSEESRWIHDFQWMLPSH